MCVSGKPQVVNYGGQKGRKKRGKRSSRRRRSSGRKRPSKVHGGGGEGSTANIEEESDNTQDVLGAVTEGAEVIGREGLLEFPIPQ